MAALNVLIPMPTPIPGIHHVTSISAEPAANLRFYTDTLGLRLVKKSINQDDPTVYHLFYADHRGSPGTSMTFFAYTDTNQGRVGTGQVHTTQFTVPASSIDWWYDRLEANDVDALERVSRFDQPVIAFDDPDGLYIELVGVEDAPSGDPPGGPVDAAHAIRGFHGIVLAVQSSGRMPALLDRFGYEKTNATGDRTRYEANGDIGSVVDLLELPEGPRGRPGAGTVHHVAFRVEDNEQQSWRDVLVEEGLRPTDIIDRVWFRSVYTRTPSGILFEFATPSPGYTVDEDLDELGETLVLPEWLEGQRENIESVLPDLPEPGF